MGKSPKIPKNNNNKKQNISELKEKTVNLKIKEDEKEKNENLEK